MFSNKKVSSKMYYIEFVNHNLMTFFEPIPKSKHIGLKSGSYLVINYPSLKAGVRQVIGLSGFSPKQFIG